MKNSIQIALAIAFVLSSAFLHPQIAPLPAAATPPPAADAPYVVPPDRQATKEQVKKLFEVMHLRGQYASMMKAFPAMIQQQLLRQEKEVTAQQPAGAKPTPQQQAELAQLQRRFFEKSFNLITVDEMLDDISGIYQRHFTRDDVDAYIAFYSTPAGQHFLQVTPVIMKEYFPLVMQRIQERSKDLAAEYSRQLMAVFRSEPPPAPKPSMPAPK